MMPQRSVETTGLTRRSFLQAGLATSALTLLAACSGQVPAPDATTPASSPPLRGNRSLPGRPS
jgi:hypothetical protein